MDLPPTDTNLQTTLLQWGSSGLALLMGAAVGISKTRRGMASDKVSRSADDAQSDVIDGLREEVSRMRAQNTELAVDLNKTQLLAARLAGELGRMTVEVEALRAQLDKIAARNATASDSKY